MGPTAEQHRGSRRALIIVALSLSALVAVVGWRFFDLSAESPRYTVENPHEYDSSLCIANDGSLVVVYDQKLTRYDNEGRVVASRDVPKVGRDTRVVAWSPGCRRGLMTGAGVADFDLYDFDDARVVTSVNGTLLNPSLPARARWVSQSTELVRLDLETGEIRDRLPGCHNCEPSPSGRYIAHNEQYRFSIRTPDDRLHRSPELKTSQSTSLLWLNDDVLAIVVHHFRRPRVYLYRVEADQMEELVTQDYGFVGVVPVDDKRLAVVSTQHDPTRDLFGRPDSIAHLEIYEIASRTRLRSYQLRGASYGWTSVSENWGWAGSLNGQGQVYVWELPP